MKIFDSVKEIWELLVLKDEDTHFWHGSTHRPQHFSIPERFFSASFMSAFIWSMPSSIRSSCSAQVAKELHRVEKYRVKCTQKARGVKCSLIGYLLVYKYVRYRWHRMRRNIEKKTLWSLSQFSLLRTHASQVSVWIAGTQINNN